MKYEVVEITEFMTGNVQNHIIITQEDGSMESFPVDEKNPRYQQFLADLEAENQGGN